MTETRIFRYALILSFLLHAFTLLVLWMTDIEYQKNFDRDVVAMVYQAEVEKIVPDKINEAHIKGLKTEKKISMPRMLTPKNAQPPEPMGIPDKNPVKIDLPDKSSPRLKEWGEKRQIKIPMLDSGKMAGSRYMTYHEQVRNKIRNRAYFYVDDPQFEEGEVYLTFVLGSDGGLKQVKIIQEKTRANNYLRGVGLRSIKESAPFPAFPKDLSYPELTFNVIISFEVGE